MANPSISKNETLHDWKIAIMCTIIYFFQGGVLRTGSLFFVESINRYNVNRQKASVPFTVATLLFIISGPFIGYFANRFQIRTIITFGSITSAFGIIACFWVENIISLTLCWGVLLGFGAGTSLSLILEIINRHFDKHLSIAVGVCVAGSSVGSAVLPYITKVLLDFYGLSGAFLILGALMLNTIPLSLDLPVYPENDTQYVDPSKITHSNQSGLYTSLDKDTQKTDLKKGTHSKELELDTSMDNDPLKIDTIKVTNLNQLDLDSSMDNRTPKIDLDNITYSNKLELDNSLDIHSLKINQPNATHLNELKLNNKSIFFIDEKKNTRNTSTFHKSCYVVNDTCKSAKPQNSILSYFAILIDPVFIVISIIQSCHTAVVASINTMLIDYCLEKDLTSNQAVYVVMVVSIMDLVGRLGLGWITDYGFIGLVNFIVGNFILFGASCLLYIWSNSFTICLVTSVVYGTIYGVIISYTPQLIKHFIEPSKRTMAVASRRFSYTPVAIAMPFILGYFKDTLKSYDGLMYALAAVSLLGAVLTFCVPHLVKREQHINSENHEAQRF